LRSIAFRFFGEEGPTTVEMEAATEGDLVPSTRVSVEACDELERLREWVGAVDKDDSACDVDEEASAESLMLIEGRSPPAEDSIRGERSEAVIFRRARVLVLVWNGASSSTVAFGTLLAGGFRLVVVRLVRLPAGATGLDVCSFSR
jgi:hypothetical protein